VKGEEKARRGEEGKGGTEQKGRGGYQDEGPLTQILNTPLFAIQNATFTFHIFKYKYDS